MVPHTDQQVQKFDQDVHGATTDITKAPEESTTTDPKHSVREASNVTHTADNKPKMILWYNLPFWLKRYSQDMNFQQCAFKSCLLSFDKRKAKESSVILFEQYLPKKAPKKLAGQKWGFLSIEPPPGTGKLYNQVQWKDKFDWIINYHRDADFKLPYGEITKQEHIPEIDYRGVFAEKTKLLVTMNSNCHALSRREVYFEELMKYLPIDQYGECGNMSCTGDRTNQEDRAKCHKKLSARYKFYLAFENSFCEDYTTEKYFNQIRDNNFMIPVVRGSPNMKEYIPSDTYINVNDFDSPKTLAEYLLKVGNDEKQYTVYLRNKHKYKTYSERELYYRTLCSICQRIHTNPGALTPKDLNKYFQNKCHEPRDLDF
ncbi:hypothetical protein FSP39_013320 [Pinctada imbricata]|uniref:Fucosyltransferase n=1 Tax=Pinctada imbricata TaxID=66713 RepID=A0AA89C1N3_PINIB|nr:hypothetical protein FSP39_013320 [Pinctada imbricata]